MYFRLWENDWPIKPTIRRLAKHAGVSCYYGRKVVQELDEFGCLQNRLAAKMDKNVARGCGLDLTLEEEVFLFGATN